MNPYIVFLITILLILIIIVIINDKIINKNRKVKFDKNKISDTERALNENKKEKMDDYQRLLTQVSTSSGFN